MREIRSKMAWIARMQPVYGVQHDVRIRISCFRRSDVLPSFKNGRPDLRQKRTILNRNGGYKMEWQLKWAVEIQAQSLGCPLDAPCPNAVERVRS